MKLYHDGIVTIVAQLPSHCGEIAELVIRDAAMLLLRSVRSCYALYALVRLRYDQRASAATVRFRHSQPSSASVTRPLRS